MIKAIRTFILAITIAAASILSIPAAEVSAQNSGVNLWAVTIGVADYQNPWIWNLEGFDDNADSLSKLLQAAWGKDHVRELLNSQATKSNIEETISWLASRADSDDIVLFYFAGHGVPDYIIPHDATNNESSFISAGELKSWLDRLDSQNITIIMDACNIGSFEDDLSEGHRVILMSSHAEEKSYTSEIAGRRTGLFSYYILEALNGGELADFNRDQLLSAEEIFDYAAARTGPASYKWYISGLVTTAQNPVLADLHEGEFNLVGRITIETIPELSATLTLNGEEYPTTDSGFLVAPGSTNEIELQPNIDKGDGIRYVFKAWQDGLDSTSRQASQGESYTAIYDTQYKLSIDFGAGNIAGDGWYDAGATAVISATPKEAAGERNTFTGWTGDISSLEPGFSISIDSPMEIKATWRTEYLLEIESAYGQPQGSGWYESGDTVMVSVEPDQGLLVRQVFDGWSGDVSDESAEATITLDSPKAITANWKTDYSRLLMLTGGLSLLAIAGFIFITTTNKRNKQTKSEEVCLKTESPKTKS